MNETGEYILSLSYGKDSMACLGAIEQLGWPLTRIVTCDIWATETIPAELPELHEFKLRADEEIKRRWGLDVDHVSAIDRQTDRQITFNDRFYRRKGENAMHNAGKIYGWPAMVHGRWCQSVLKIDPLSRFGREHNNAVQYIGIAADEAHRRIALDGVMKKSPLVEIRWTEADCRKWCIENDLLSPLYEMGMARDGCWFCPCKNTNYKRWLRNNHPELWNMILEWDKDSPLAMTPQHRAAEYELRFRCEDAQIVKPGRRFRWEELEQVKWMLDILPEGTGNEINHRKERD